MYVVRVALIAVCYYLLVVFCFVCLFGLGRVVLFVMMILRFVVGVSVDFCWCCRYELCCVIVILVFGFGWEFLVV